MVDLGKKYYLNEYINPGNVVQTNEIQNLIDNIALNGGGVLIVSGGIYKTGSLFFKQGVNLFIEKDSMIFGLELGIKHILSII